MTKPKDRSSGKPPPGRARKKPGGGSPHGDGVGDTLRAIRSFGSRDRQLQAGQDLFGPGAPSDVVYYLVEGWVSLYSILESGRRQILHFAMPGAVLGFPQAHGGLTTFGAQALTDVVASVIRHKDLRSLSKKRPEIGLQLAQLMAEDLSVAFDHLTSVGRQSARERVARLLLELFMRSWSQWSGDGVETMHLPLTQEHVADATGLTPVHVNRVMRALQREGIVEFHYRRLRILNPDKLIDVAGIDPTVASAWFQRRRSR